MMDSTPTLTPSDFVAIFNQTLDFAYPVVIINGEVSNLRVSKGKWVYFDIKDETATLRCFATTYNLRLPVEDGMKVTITAKPQLHPLYNLSLTIIDITPTGEGSIKQATDLLKDKLEKEGLFAPDKKRVLPYPPSKIGLITSSESAAYGDFIKIIIERWPLLIVTLKDTKVQGVGASEEISEAVHFFNQHADVEVLVIIRGGGSTDDLIAFQHEQLVRSIAESRIPTLVAIGHERDISLSELAADVRASTPSNAAELLVPSVDDIKILLNERLASLHQNINHLFKSELEKLNFLESTIAKLAENALSTERGAIKSYKDVLKVLDPNEILRKGYSVVRGKDGVIREGKKLKDNDLITIQFLDSERNARVVG